MCTLDVYFFPRNEALCHVSYKIAKYRERGGPGKEGGRRLTGWKELSSLRQTHTDQVGVAS